jgi:enoyl-CoA hydratase/carnithine racemase
MADTGLVAERKGRVLTLTIDRENKRNSLDAAVVHGLMTQLEQAESAPDVRAVCITGAGDKAFCAGADLAGSMASPKDAFSAFADLMILLDSMTTPTVARVNGHCAGGGVGLVLGCDIAIAADDVTFATPETRLGLFPLMIGPLMLRHLGRRRALDMILTGRRIGATEAASWQLVSRAVARGDLDAAVDETLESITKAGPVAVSRGRRALFETEGLRLEEAEPILLAELTALASGEEAAEGIAAFLQKRPPKWSEE